MLVVMAAWSMPASAQQYFDPGLMQTGILSMPAQYQPRGTRLGSFMLSPAADVIYGHNDNIFYLEEDELSDSTFYFRPRADLNSDWNRHSLNVSAWADIARYDKYSTEDFEDWSVRLDGRVDVRHNSYFSYEASTMQLHEDRRSPDNQLGIMPNVFDYGGWGLGYDHVFNRLKLGVYYRRTTFDYENNIDGEGDVVDNMFRNRDQDQISLRADYQFHPQKSVYASYSYNEIEYANVPDFDRFVRDSEGWTAAVGITFDITEVLVGDVSLSYNEQKYDSPFLRDVSGWGIGAGLTWTPTQLTTINFRLAGSPQETTQIGTSGYFSQLYSVRLQHELLRHLLFNARISYTDNSYEPLFDIGVLSDTQVLRAGIGLSWLINRNFSLTGGYMFEQQDANISTFEYEANKYFLMLSLAL